MNEISVLKRDGRKEPLELEKFHAVTAYACEGLSGVSVSDLELKSRIQFYNNIKTTDIQETLIKAAADLISEESPNYQFVAGRLINYNLRKEVYGSYTPPSLYKHWLKIKDVGYYDSALEDQYSPEEWYEINKMIDHERDNLLTYAAMEQFRGKYLIKHRVTGEFFETPQMAFMLISMTLFANYTKDRLKWVEEFYNALSQFDISLPTPIMSGIRGTDKQFSSCVLIECDDTLKSIFQGTAATIGTYVSQKAGIGIGAGKLRGEGSSIRDGRAYHTGVIPFFRLFQSSVKSCSQGGVRGGAATLYYPFWHWEVEDLLVLKNNKGTEDNRVRHLDYGVQFNKVMYERLLEGGNITLFSPADVPDLYDAFFVDNDKFRELYEKYERAYSIRKKSVPAIELFSTFMQERKDTGRIYLMNVDHCNSHGAFVESIAPIRMSNLCCEITLPTTPLQSFDDENGEISLCTLGAINWGKIKKPEDFKKPCELIVRALNELLDYQKYPVPAAEKGTKNRRPLGVGIINFAYWLAKNDSNYSNPNLDLVHQYTEAWSYYLIKASADLAEETGKGLHTLAGAESSKYIAEGKFPIDTYKKDVDELVKPIYNMDWDGLRTQVKNYGMMNSTLMALMPSETSSQISGATNSIEPPRSLVPVKQSKDGVLKQVVPEIRKLKNKYELLWDQKSPEGYLKICAVLQKFIDQAISVNTSYNPKFYEDGKIPLSVMMQDMLMHYKYGGKTLYYCNVNDGATDEEEPLMLGELDEENCESCTI